MEKTDKKNGKRKGKAPEQSRDTTQSEDTILWLSRCLLSRPLYLIVEHFSFEIATGWLAKHLALFVVSLFLCSCLSQNLLRREQERESGRV